MLLFLETFQCVAKAEESLDERHAEPSSENCVTATANSTITAALGV